MSKEALKLALEALELHLTHHEHGCVYLDPAVTAIKEALAQPERHELQAKGEHPAPCARFCEANAFNIEIRRMKAQRKPLTMEQKLALCKQFPDHLTFNAIHAIEAAHGIKE